MSGGLSQQGRTDALTYFGGGTAGTQPAAWYASLHTGDPGDAATIANEASGGGYARVQIFGIPSGSSPRWSAVTGTTTNILANNASVSFPTSSGAVSSGSNLTWFGICSASSAGNLLASGSLTSPVAIAGSGVTVTFSTGNLQLSAART